MPTNWLRQTRCFSRFLKRWPPSSDRSLAAKGTRVFDLSGAYRLRASGDRERWYPHSHAPSVPVTYGLTERYRARADRRRKLVACAGCYPTAAILALQPLAAAGLIEPGVIIDAKSGVSGAGKTPTERTHFSECHGSIAAYGVFAHRHAAEIEQELGMSVTFVPHLVPLDRGILETIYVRLKPGVTEAVLQQTLTQAYKDSAFVRLTARGAAGDQARRLHELLRYRLAGRTGRDAGRDGRLHRQPGEGGRRPGHPELQRGVRIRRNGGTELTTLLKLGGELLEDAAAVRSAAAAILRLRASGPVVVVHGGGRAIDAELRRRGPDAQVC